MTDNAGKEQVISHSLKDFATPEFSMAQYEALTPFSNDNNFTSLTISIISDDTKADSIFEELHVKGQMISPYKFSKEGDQQNKDKVVDEKVIAEEEVKKQIEQAKELAFNQGLATGKAEADAKIKELSEQLNSKLEELSKGKKEHFVKLEEKALQLALDVAKKILITTAELRPEYIIDVIKNGLSCLGAERPLRIRVSPDDMEFLQVVGLPPELSAAELGIEYVSDETIHSGCVIETDFGELDAQLEHMWEQVREELYEVSK